MRTELDGIVLTPDHAARAVRLGYDAASSLRIARQSLAETIRHLEQLLSFATPDDPNRSLIEGMIDKLR
jgi:cytochrome c-type biogenesis protein CcmH/NrfG